MSLVSVSASAAPASTTEGGRDVATLTAIADKVRWIATSIVDTANRVRPNPSGLKVGGHQASSASIVEIMTSLWFHELDQVDRVAVKPHASPVMHAINYLLGEIDEHHLDKLRVKGGLQSYPSRRKDPGTVDFSTGSVGIGATAPLWAALSHRYLRSTFPTTPKAGRFVSLLGDAELDEGAIWEAVADPSVSKLGELLWIVDLNRQSLDRVVPDIQIERLQGMFEAAGWQVMTLKWGRAVTALFERPGGDELRERLESMPNEEYQRMLRADAAELVDRLVGEEGSDALRALVTAIPTAELAYAVRDLGGHDMGLLLDTYDQVDDHRPTVVFAYTIKGRGLPIEGHPSNHAALLSEAQMLEYAEGSGNDINRPWVRFEAGSDEEQLCVARAQHLARPAHRVVNPTKLPTSLGHGHKSVTSTQAALGRLLADLVRDVPDIASRVVTCSPDVASSTNLGGWINKTGVWSPSERRDWFADDKQRVLRWSEATSGQHIELGIAEVNLVSLLGELGATWSRWGERLIPIGTIYDPFVTRALEPWSYGMYAGGQSILVGTPSGVTLAPEGGAHQSITTPSVGLEQPECIAWEPAFAQDLEWTMLHAMDQIGIPGGTSSYFRLTTRQIDQELATVPADEHLLERRRRHALAGGYRLRGDAATDQVTLVGVGAMLPEVCAAADALAASGVEAGIIVLTSPDLVHRAFDARNRAATDGNPALIDLLFPAEHKAPIVSVQDGHPHTLSFLGAIRGDRSINLGVRDFGQSSDLDDAHALHGIDTASIVDAALTLVGR